MCVSHHALQTDREGWHQPPLILTYLIAHNVYYVK